MKTLVFEKKTNDEARRILKLRHDGYTREFLVSCAREAYQKRLHQLARTVPPTDPNELRIHQALISAHQRVLANNGLVPEATLLQRHGYEA